MASTDDSSGARSAARAGTQCSVLIQYAVFRSRHPIHGTPCCVLRTAYSVCRRGLTLLELVVALAIVVATASVAVLSSGALLQDSRGDVTRQSLRGLRDVIAQTYWQDNASALPRPNMAVTITQFPNRQNAAQLRYLFVNPATEDTTVTYNPAYRLGWRGPYMVANNGAVYSINTAANFTEQYGENGDPTVLDGWGNPIVIQNPGTWADGGQDVAPGFGRFQRNREHRSQDAHRDLAGEPEPGGRRRLPLFRGAVRAS